MSHTQNNRGRLSPNTYRKYNRKGELLGDFTGRAKIGGEYYHIKAFKRTAEDGKTVLRLQFSEYDITRGNWEAARIHKNQNNESEA